MLLFLPVLLPSPPAVADETKNTDAKEEQRGGLGSWDMGGLHNHTYQRIARVVHNANSFVDGNQNVAEILSADFRLLVFTVNKINQLGFSVSLITHKEI